MLIIGTVQRFCLYELSKDARMLIPDAWPDRVGIGHDLVSHKENNKKFGEHNQSLA